MDWKSKLTSRKFWSAIVNFVTQLMFAYKFTDNEVAQVAAIIMAGAGVVAYIIGEGMTDSASASAETYVIHDGKPPEEGAKPEAPTKQADIPQELESWS